jgi:ubiquinone/menaquinone biosynthesis C-methylase UbiE
VSKDVDIWAAKRDVKRFYDKIASSYDELYREEQAGKYQGALEVKGSPWLGKILDVGCGTGLFLEAINACGDGERMVFGVDISLRLLKLASHRLKGQSYLICADADFLPFPNETFNTVVAFTLLQNVPDPIAALKEIKRVLMPLGTLVATYLKEKITLTEFKQLLKEAGVTGEPLSCIVSNEHVLTV